ncbi:MAG: tetratricopeptide repeat protein, partial [Prosthecobacter sp.]
PEEERIVATLSYPTEPIPVTAIAEISGVNEPITLRTLKLLTNRSIVVPQEGEEKYALVPMVAEFIRHARRELVKEMGDRLAERAFRLIEANGYYSHKQFPVLDAMWPSIAPSLALFLIGPNERLQTLCKALNFFFDFSGRWDAWYSINCHAEGTAVSSGDYSNAGWRAYSLGLVHFRRRAGEAVLVCADRAAQHWLKAGTNGRERPAGLRLHGLGHHLSKNYSEAIKYYRDAEALWRILPGETINVAVTLNNLADTERCMGNLALAQQSYREALRRACENKFPEGVATYTGNLAEVALELTDWLAAEKLSRESLALSEILGRQELIGTNCYRLGLSLMRQGQITEAKNYAQRAVDIYTYLSSPHLVEAQAVLARCIG